MRKGCPQAALSHIRRPTFPRLQARHSVTILTELSDIMGIVPRRNMSEYRADERHQNDALPEPESFVLWLRRLWPLYCLLAVVVTFGYALYDAYQIDGDAVAYM